MSLFPFNPNAGQRMQTDTPGVTVDRAFVVHFECTPSAHDDDYFVESTTMKVGAYTLAHTTPGDDCAHNVTVTQTAVGAEDTNGTITVTGTDLAGNVISEEITPNAGATVAGAKAFATVTSVVGAGWVINEGNDTIVVGFGDKIGLPDKLPLNTVLAAFLNDVREGTAPTVAVSASDLASNTCDLNSALDGNDVDLFYLV